MTIEFDWYCENCNAGFYSLDIDESDDQDLPLCPYCTTQLKDYGEVDHGESRSSQSILSDEIA